MSIVDAVVTHSAQILLSIVDAVVVEEVLLIVLVEDVVVEDVVVERKTFEIERTRIP